jgi:ethanolamine utilization protein EutN
MQLGRVTGKATATMKHATLDGWRLLLVQPLNATGSADGDPVLAIDELGAGENDQVLLTSDGPSVREMVKSKNSPIRWAVIGVVDESA